VTNPKSGAFNGTSLIGLQSDSLLFGAWNSTLLSLVP
jgi:hypothetical protein